MITPNQATPEERFILLSAYLDQEVTHSEKQLVEEWLTHDQQFRSLYQQQLRLRGALRELPVPQTQINTQISTEQIVSRAIAQTQTRNRYKLLTLVGTASLALFSALVGVFTTSPNQRPLEFGVANQTMPRPEDTERLIIALEKPIIPLPNALSNTSSSLQRR